MSSLPSSSSGMFSALPLVLRGSTASVGSVSLMVSAAAPPNSGKPPPGVAVPSTTLIFCAAAAVVMTVTVRVITNRSRAIFIRGPSELGRKGLRQVGDDILLVLEPDRQPYHIGSCAGLHFLGVG